MVMFYRDSRGRQKNKRVSRLREKILNVINQIDDEVKLTTIYKFILGLIKKAEK